MNEKDSQVRVRISGDGTHTGTKISDTRTGDPISLVQGYTITHRVGGIAKAVIDVAAPQIDLECDAEIRGKMASPDYLSAAVAARRLSPSDIEASIAETYWFTAADGANRAGYRDEDGATPAYLSAENSPLGLVTFCVLILRNGAKVVGINYGAIDPAQHSEQRGREESRKQAIEKVWELLGFELRSKLAAGN